MRLDVIPLVNIREATAADAEAISTLAAEFHRYLQSLGDHTSFYFNATTYLRDGFGPNPAFFGFVAEIEGTVVGYLLYHFGYDTDQSRRLAFIIDLYVGEKYRGQRIGTALMKRAAAAARDQGATDLFWSVYERNESALRFYESLGAQYVKGIHFMAIDVEALT